jgi:hypothetical protein
VERQRGMQSTAGVVDAELEVVIDFLSGELKRERVVCGRLAMHTFSICSSHCERLAVHP